LLKRHASPSGEKKIALRTYLSQSMPYSVYILLSKSRTRTYTGVAADVDERLKRHNDGHVPASRPYRPYEIIYVEAYPTLKEARQRERFYKSTTGRRRLRKLISQLSTNVNH
jgi:putative endonuclease